MLVARVRPSGAGRRGGGPREPVVFSGAAASGGERFQRSGELRRARLFDDLEIADEPPLVYAVAPLFRFHRAFAALARMISPEIEMYRFDINEDWRSGVGAAVSGGGKRNA